MAGIETPEFLADDQKIKKFDANSSNGDESSIEALNWSDLEDDLNDEDFKLTQSINSKFSDLNEEVKFAGLGFSTHSSHDGKANLEGSTATVTNEVRNTEVITPDLKLSTDMVRSTLSIGSDMNTIDSASNAPVLDDGPIWAKGSKLYKFEENRRFNQKLTFCVLLSVVLAIGLGLGNLAAFNECEAEYKDKMSSLHEPIEKLSWGKDSIAGDIPLSRRIQPQSIPTAQLDSIPRPRQSENKETVSRAKDEDLKTSSSHLNEMKYTVHAEELSRVLTMLDELSRKIDKFENTTRQLGGIVLLKDDMVAWDSTPKKGKFLSLLDDVMKTKIKKQKPAHKHVTQQDIWRAKKEQILDDIAEAVLGAMEVTKETLHESAAKMQEKKLLNLKWIDPNRDARKTKLENIVDSSIPEQNTHLHSFENHRELYTQERYKEKLKPTVPIPDKPMVKLPKSSEDTEKKISNNIAGGERDSCKKKYVEKRKRQIEKSRDWQSDRAKYRQENRERQESVKFNGNRKFKNWQIERDSIRAKLRN